MPADEDEEWQHWSEEVRLAGKGTDARLQHEAAHPIASQPQTTSAAAILLERPPVRTCLVVHAAQVAPPKKIDAGGG